MRILLSKSRPKHKKRNKLDQKHSHYTSTISQIHSWLFAPHLWINLPFHNFSGFTLVQEKHKSFIFKSQTHFYKHDLHVPHLWKTHFSCKQFFWIYALAKNKTKKNTFKSQTLSYKHAYHITHSLNKPTYLFSFLFLYPLSVLVRVLPFSHIVHL